MNQLDLFAPLPAPPHHARQSRKAATRAFNHGGLISIYGEDDPEPFEIEVRGVPCIIAYSGGFCTHAINPPGSLFWSETGFRSFGIPTTDTGEIEAAILSYVDSPAKAYGMGGKLVKWWPGYVLQWRQSIGFEIEMTRQGGREAVWD